MENAPEWFLDLFLDFMHGFNEQKEKFLKYGSSKFTQTTKSIKLSGYGLLQKNSDSILFIGKREKAGEDGAPVTEVFHYKHAL